MSLQLSELLAQLSTFRGPIVDNNGSFSPDFFRFVYNLIDQTTGVETDAATAQSTATTAQATATTAQTQADLSGYRVVGDGQVWHSDAIGTQPADASTFDLVARFRDESAVEIATRTLRGTYTQVGDSIAVTALSTTGEATTFTLDNDGTGSVRAVVTHTASGAIAVLTWGYLDETTSGSIPATGGGK